MLVEVSEISMTCFDPEKEEKQSLSSSYSFGSQTSEER